MSALRYAPDLEIGIPVNTPPLTEAQRRAADMRKGEPYPFHGRGPAPKNWEETRWLEDFRRAGCDIIASHGQIGYRIPGKREAEGFPILDWLFAAEKRVPGIRYRACRLALDLDSIAEAVESQKPANLAKRETKKALAA